MKFNPGDPEAFEAIDAVLQVWPEDTVTVVRHAIHALLADTTALAERIHLEYADELLIHVERKRAQDIAMRAREGVKGYWEKGVPGTDNGGKPALKVVKPDDSE